MATQRGLTDKQVQACENAVGATCRCRCGGALHGRGGGGTAADGGIDRAYFEHLPADDPHHMRTAEAAKAERAAARIAKREARDRKRQDAYDWLYANRPTREPGEW